MSSSSVDFSNEDVQEFRVEALDLLDLAENHLLALDRGESLKGNYDSIFRTFHNIKGSAGVLGWNALQEHVHQLESNLMKRGKGAELSKDEINEFLVGVDICRVILNGGDPKKVEKSAPSNERVEQIEFVDARNIKFSQSKEGTNYPPAVIGSSSSGSSQQTNELPSRTTFQVVVIDDEPDLVDVAKNILEDAGFVVHGYTSAEEALEAIAQSPPDVVVTDMRMPNLSGYDILKRVREMNADLPVIYVSGHLTMDLVIKSISSGIFGALEKPLSETQLVSVCTAAAQRYQTMKLLDRTINFLMYQFSDLDQFLVEKQRPDLRDKIRTEMKTILEVRRKLKLMKLKSRH